MLDTSKSHYPIRHLVVKIELVEIMTFDAL